MKKRSINNNIIKTTYIFSILFYVLIIFLVFLVLNGDSIIDNSYNKRIDTLNNYVNKGQIYSANMEVLAYTDETTGERIYPYNDLLCHIIGYSEMGTTGLEETYKYEMLTSDMNIFSKFMNEVSGEKHPGNSIVSTLDVELSKNCYDALSGYKGSVIVMDSENGDVLSMVSNPTYNPNLLTENWDSIVDSEDSVLLNRATSGLYTPGSVFKIVTLYSYITENPNKYSEYSFLCKGQLDFSNYSISCSGHVWHGEENLKKSFANSCNCSFVTISDNVSISGIENVCDKLLFNKELPLDVGYKSSTFSIYDDQFTKHQTVIGQGKTLVTPIHMTMIMNAIANEGVMMKPRFVTSILDYAGNEVESFEPEEYKEIFTKEESELLSEYLREVVVSGTASDINSTAYELYGKTGTAQIDSKGNVNSWFLGYVKIDNRTYTICVVVENVNENISPAKEITRKIINSLT